MESAAIELLLKWGYPALFLLGFLSASILPLGSAFALPVLHELGYDTIALVVVATAGNYLGSLSNYMLGKYGGNYLVDRWLQPDEQARHRAKTLYNRYGQPILFFSWIPIVGDAITFVAGVLKGNLIGFSFWVALGKMGRYIVVIWGYETLTGYFMR